MGAALVDTLVPFFVLYLYLLYAGGSPLAQAVTWEPFVVIGFYLWYLFSVLGFAPLLVAHGYSARWFLIGAGLLAVYGAAFEAVFGWTPGKRLFGIVVREADGSSLTVRSALIRNAFRYVDAIGLYAVGFLILALTERRQRLGDLAAGTVVLVRERRLSDSVDVPGRESEV